MNTDIMIDRCDILSANLVQQGHELVRLRLTGVRDWEELVSYVLSYVHGDLGRVRLWVRNSTRGWAVERQLVA